MAEILASALRNQAGVPWQQCRYGINRTGVRGKRFLEAGLPQNYQYTVTMPSDIALAEHVSGTLFNWRKGMDGIYALVPTGDTVIGRHIKIWTPEMEMALDHMTNKELAETFNISVSAVSSKRYELSRSSRDSNA